MTTACPDRLLTRIANSSTISRMRRLPLRFGTIAALCAIWLAIASSARAQSFTYRALAETRSVPFALDDNEWIRDHFASMTATGADPQARAMRRICPTGFA